MGKKEKKAFEEKIKKDVKRKTRETDEEYLRRIMGKKAVKKPLEPVDPTYLNMNSDKIITHEDQEGYR